MTEAERLYVIPFSDSLQMYVLACHFQLEAEVAIAAAQFFKTKGPGSICRSYFNKTVPCCRSSPLELPGADIHRVKPPVIQTILKLPSPVLASKIAALASSFVERLLNSRGSTDTSQKQSVQLRN